MSGLTIRGLQSHPAVQWLRKALAIAGITLVAYLLYRNWGVLVNAISESPGTFIVGTTFGILSLLVQSSGFRSFPKITFLSQVQIADIWSSAIIFNHVFPLAGGLGYRFLTLKVKGVELKDTGRATLWFLGTSASTATVALVTIYLFDSDMPILAVLVVMASVGLVPVLTHRLFGKDSSFVYVMIGHQIAQVFLMGLLVLLGARLGDLELSLSQGAALGCVMRLGSLISLTPAGLGIQEAIIVGVLATYGVTTEESTATAIMVRILYLASAVAIAITTRLILRFFKPESKIEPTLA